jgi:hypothetical protein
MNLAPTLKEQAGPWQACARRGSARTVGLQVALSLLLLGAGLFARTLFNLRRSARLPPEACWPSTSTRR